MKLDEMRIILVRPKFPENLGAIARAMKNMGFHRLVIVNGCSPFHMGAYRLASGAEEILERAEEFLSLDEAVSEMGCVVGMTSREGRDRSPLLSPRDLVERLHPISENNPIGLVFGSEREGLRNEELSLCNLFVRIPASPAFPSLNLAHAVMVLCYELSQSSGRAEHPLSPLATSEQLERMFEQMERTLTGIGFLDSKHPERMMRTLRKIFGKRELDPREVRILRGIWSQVDWVLKNSRESQK